ncbi:MAG: class I SAM-dependent methyltransferase [Sphingomonas bacterium]|nr:class I SAM-dependent methyltransferase [Sphingomonas bacterium]
MTFDAGSFRDPSGRVFRHDRRILRAIFDAGVPAYEAARASGVLDRAIARGRLVAAESVDSSLLDQVVPGTRRLLEHPRLDFISYPYEWTFSALRAAAIHHLDFHLELLADGFTLSDATAYNIQFRGCAPVFIDHLSIIPYDEGAAWTGQRQFGMQFLNPLFLWAKRGIAPHAWYRGSVEGIEPEELVKLLGWRDKMSFTVLAHIVGPAMVARRRVVEGLDTKPPRVTSLSKARLVAMLTSLRDYVAGLSLPTEKTVWDDYAGNNSYDEERRAAKHGFVADAVASVQPHLLFDIGCNSGDFSQTALDSGATSVVGFDFDFGALERAFSRFSKSAKPMLPLWLDATNPSPGQGWAGAERQSMDQRADAGMMLGLAVIHHLAIAKNVPLDMAIDWLMGLAPTGVIEFPSKSDPMVQQLLRHRPDIFPDYTEDAFLHHVGQRGAIRRQEHLGETGRLIVAYDKRG